MHTFKKDDGAIYRDSLGRKYSVIIVDVREENGSPVIKMKRDGIWADDDSKPDFCMTDD